jgi:DNA-binding NarL/FixJ family response regulator/class 3 adenylate cyclase
MGAARVGERPEETVTFLFTDIEGSTALLQRLGDRYRDVLAAVRELLGSAVDAGGGRVIDSRGDEVFACFAEPQRALEAALRAQGELLAREWPEGERVRVRMGVHTGRASEGAEGFVGLDVHRAARISASGHGGQVLVSDVTRQQVPQELLDLGEHDLPGLPAPERIHQLVARDLPSAFPPLRNARPRRPAVRVVIADDSVLLREGIARLLEDAGMEVEAQSGTAEDALVQVEEHRPDLAILDIRMPPSHTDEGLRAAQTIRERFPDTSVLVLSQYVEAAYAIELLSQSAGGVGYLLKDRIAHVDDFAEAVLRVAGGGSAVDPEIAHALLAGAAEAVAGLTERERGVLRLLAEGRSDEAIAERLFVAVGEVERVVARIFEKLRLPAAGEDRRRVLAVLSYLRA